MDCSQIEYWFIDTNNISFLCYEKVRIIGRQKGQHHFFFPSTLLIKVQIFFMKHNPVVLNWFIIQFMLLNMYLWLIVYDSFWYMICRILIYACWNRNHHLELDIYIQLFQTLPNLFLEFWKIPTSNLDF